MEQEDTLKSLARDKFISDSIINNSRSMISIINRNYIYEKVNDTFCLAHNIITDSIIGHSISDVWGHETFNDLLKNNIDLCFDGKTVRYEASFHTPQYGKRHFEVVFRPLSVEGGEITHLLAETFDIDDIKRTEQAILEKEAELRNFETNLPIGFIRCTIEGKILQANKAFVEILNCKNEDTIIGSDLKLYYGEDGLFDVQVDQLKECITQSFGMIPVKNCKGDEIPCRVSGYMGFNSMNEPSFIDLAIEDASRELMLENRLLQAQKLETIGALAGGIAHDFNNILATIAGYSELLLEDLNPGTEVTEKVICIQGAVSKAQSIINQMLTFSRQVEQVKIHTSVSEVLRETIGFMKSALPYNVFLKSRISNKEAVVFADPTQLFRIFLNLITNAVQAMESDGGIISVNMSFVGGKMVKDELNKDIVADDYVVIAFRDTGRGMDVSGMNRIFEPYYTTREVGKGTGLGLSVVHGILAELEGDIEVVSKKGKGSVFKVYLPLSKEFAEASYSNGNNKKILFISGNKHESRILSLALKNSGYELLYVSDRRKLIKVISDDDTRPDLMVYMYDSEKINTEDLIGVFQKMELDIPCILITDTVHGQLEEKLLHSGIIKQHLIKPVSLKEILNAIQVSLL